MTKPQWYLHEKHKIPREIDGIKIRVVELRPNQDVKGGHVVRQGDANCRHPHCYRIRPVGGYYCNVDHTPKGVSWPANCLPS